MKILIADDDRLTRRILAGFLGPLGYEVLEAENGAQAFEAITAKDIRLVITDWMMPNVDGLELIRRLRTLSDGHLIYIILLTAKEQTAELIEAMNAGADDFIRKPFDRDELRVRVRAGERIIDLTERLERLAMTDSLTGLLNRRGLHDAYAMRQAHHECLGDRGLGFIIADLDHFKQVNDRYGHAAGDLVLQQTSTQLKAIFEPQGIVARMGGEEFWVLLCDCHADELAWLTEGARRAIATTDFVLATNTDQETPSIHLTASFGIAHTTALGKRRLEDLFEFADQALYHAKENGRNRVVSRSEMVKEQASP